MIMTCGGLARVEVARWATGRRAHLAEIGYWCHDPPDQRRKIPPRRSASAGVIHVDRRGIAGWETSASRYRLRRIAGNPPKLCGRSWMNWPGIRPEETVLDAWCYAARLRTDPAVPAPGVAKVIRMGLPGGRGRIGETAPPTVRWAGFEHHGDVRPAGPKPRLDERKPGSASR